MSSKQRNIVQFHTVPRVRISLVLVLIIMVYVIFHMFTYFTRKHVAITEVRQGSIVSDDHYDALAIRSEKVVKAASSGYLYYYLSSLSRIGASQYAYSIDSNGQTVEKLKEYSEDDASLSDTQKKQLAEKLLSFSEGFNTSDYSSLYSFYAQAQASLTESLAVTARSSLKNEIQQASADATFQSFATEEPGLVVLNVDGMENISLKNFKEEDFDTSKVNEKNLASVDKIQAGEPVYRLVTSDNWNLVMPLTEDKAKELRDTTGIEITFLEDGAKTWCTSHVTKRDDRFYLILSLDDSVDRYASERFVSIDLSLEKKNGLKVPNSSLKQQILYEIPKNYITYGGDENTPSILRKIGDGHVVTKLSLYQKDADGTLWGTYNGLKQSDVILNPSTLQEKTVQSLEVKKGYGVFNVNKGYAQFALVQILFHNEQYSIIQPVHSSQLALYDHIALEASDVTEDEIVNGT